MKKRIISIMLALVLLVGLLAVPASAAESKTDGSQYQTVMVHGLFGFGYNDGLNDILPYWGMSSGDMIEYLGTLGYDCVSAAVGPLSSCHDRCCELFAQLTGTVTDYGAAHSAKVAASYANESNDLKHDRYGRDYTGEAIVKGWGPIYENGKVVGWYDSKLNLIGHSFGGPTIVQFLELLAEGDANEISWGKEQARLYGGDWHDYVSPLFWGDYNGQYLINSLTSLAGVLNGTTFLDVCRFGSEVVTTVFAYLANTLGLTDAASFYDFQLEHFGISKTPGQDPTVEEFFSSAKVQAFLAGYDNALYDLSIEGCNYLKQGWETYDNVYYFAYAGNKTYRDPLTGNYLPDADMLPLLLPFSLKMGSSDYDFEQVFDIYGDPATNPGREWLPNDGMVNTVSARYPIGAAQKELDRDNIEAGIWQWMDMDYDHLGFSGGLLDPRIISTPAETRRFYRELMTNIESTTPINDEGSVLPFTDVAKNRWSYNYIKALYDMGVINGVTPTLFCPTEQVTRAQFVKMLACLEGIDVSGYSGSVFKDVSAKSFYAPYIMWAYESGVVKGYDRDHFKPGQSISRQEIAAMISRYCDYAGIDLPVVSKAVVFTDEASILDYAKPCVHKLQLAGIIAGYPDGSFGPFKYTSREEACAMLYRLCGI